jgi:[ribosomal protein S18]-alanine N-acetyltransferase
VRRLRDPDRANEPLRSREAEPAHARAMIERVATASADLVEIDGLARLCNMDEAFSIREELTRPWARVWVTKLPKHDRASHEELARGLSVRARGASTDVAAFLVAWHVADELHVLNVATSPAERRRGIATALMLEALRYATDQRVRIVLLEVRRSNRAAIKLYRKLGFTAMGIRPGYYSDNNEDAVEMVIALDPSTGTVVPGRDEVRIEL